VIEIAIGTLDNPDLAEPAVQVNAGSQRACFRGLAELPEKPADQQQADEAWNASVISNQHPDFET